MDKSSEVRTVSRVGKYTVYFVETPGLSISKYWFPDVKVEQKWRRVVDYLISVIGRVMAVELIEEE